MTGTDLPEGWTTLIEALSLLGKHATNQHYPFQCRHDRLNVLADDKRFTPEEITQLDEWGFHVDKYAGGFYSFEYGSA